MLCFTLYWLFPKHDSIPTNILCSKCISTKLYTASRKENVLATTLNSYNSIKICMNLGLCIGQARERRAQLSILYNVVSPVQCHCLHIISSVLLYEEFYNIYLRLFYYVESLLSVLYFLLYQIYNIIIYLYLLCSSCYSLNNFLQIYLFISELL